VRRDIRVIGMPSTDAVYCALLQLNLLGLTVAASSSRLRSGILRASGGIWDGAS
jgi:hypothetical protein